MKKLIVVLAVFLIVLGAIFYGVKLYNKIHKANQPVAINGTYFDMPRAIGPFALKDNKGQNFDDTRFLNQWSLVFFGYSRCPDICPKTLKILKNVYSKLQDTTLNSANLPQIVFISVDTEREAIHDLSNFVNRFNPDFIGVSGDKSQVAALGKNLGVIYQKLSVGQNEENYIYDHSSTIYVINPQGALQAIFTAPHDSKTLAHQYELLIDHYKLTS